MPKLGRQVLPNEPLRIKAGEWNAVRDLAISQRPRARRSKRTRQTGICRVYNNSGAAVQRYGVLGITGVLCPPETPPEDPPGPLETEFKAAITLTGETPDGAKDQGKFVICLDYIADGDLGPAIHTGGTQALIDVVDEDHQFADVKDGDASQLQSAASGAAQIFYKESGTGTKLAVVRLGVPPAPFDFLAFSGGCRIDEENPDTAYADTLSFTNQRAAGSGSGAPEAGKQERVLVKLARPIPRANVDEAILRFQTACAWTLGNAGGNPTPVYANVTFQLEWITEDFDTSGEGCATWNSAPAVNAAVYGNEVAHVNVASATRQTSLADNYGGGYLYPQRGGAIGQPAEAVEKVYGIRLRVTNLTAYDSTNPITKVDILDSAAVVATVDLSLCAARLSW